MVPVWDDISAQNLPHSEITSFKHDLPSLNYCLPYFGLSFDNDRLLEYYLDRSTTDVQNDNAIASICLHGDKLAGFQVCGKVGYLSEYFGINCGSITITGLSPNLDLRHNIAKVLCQESVNAMKTRGVEFVSASVYAGEKALIHASENCGFHLVEIFANYTQDITEMEFPSEPEGFRIRDCVDSDIEQIKNIYMNETFPGRLIAEPKFSKKKSYALYGLRFQEVYKKKIGRIFIAERDGLVVGALIGIIDNDLYEATGIKTNVLSGMGIIIDRQSRGMGIATHLISERMRWFQDEGVQKVSFGASIENVPMIRGLVKLGMKFTSASCIFHAWL